MTDDADKKDTLGAGLPTAPQFGGGSAGLPTAPQFGGPGGLPTTPAAPTPTAPRPTMPHAPAPLPEPSPMAIWGPRLLAAVVAFAVAYGVWGLFDSGLSVERVGPGPSAGSKVVVLLHGAGASGDDLVPLAEECAAAAPEITFLVPEGPHRAYGGRVWAPRFSAESREAYTVRLAREIQATHELVWQVIEDARKDGVACGDIYVGGFSQGGRMAAEVVVRAPKDCTLGGAIVMSGGGFNEVNISGAERPKMRVLVAHGKQDGVVAFAAGNRMARFFADADHDVWMLPFEGPHHIPPAVRQAIPKFVRGEEVGDRVESP